MLFEFYIHEMVDMMTGFCFKPKWAAFKPGLRVNKVVLIYLSCCMVQTLTGSRNRNPIVFYLNLQTEDLGNHRRNYTTKQLNQD